MHNMSVENIINKTSLTELTQDKMTSSPNLYKLPSQREEFEQK